MESMAGFRIVSVDEALGPRTVLVSKKLATCHQQLTASATGYQTVE